MDIQIKNYTFDKTLKIITFDNYVSIRLDSIRVITNVTENTVIYNFAQKGRGGSVVGNVLTLEYDTALMNDVDDLQIVYNDDEVKATETGQQSLLTELGKANTKYTMRLIESSVYTYIGEAEVGSNEGDAVWRVKRLDETTGLDILWADGNEDFDNIWNNYATLTYS